MIASAHRPARRRRESGRDGRRTARETHDGTRTAATGGDYRRLPVDGLGEYEGLSVFYAAGPPEAQHLGASRVGVGGGGNSAGQAAVWLARGGARVTLLHRRADVRETMSDYLVRELGRYGVAVRDRCEVPALHGDGGHLAAVARDATGFVLTGGDAQAGSLLETTVPGIFAAGDARSGSTKRCATAVGEGAMAVQLIHAHVARRAARSSNRQGTP